MRRILLVLLALVPIENSLAQVSAQASIASDYLYRGVSFTGGRPVAALEADYDSPSGWFAGALATATHFYGQSHYEPEYVIDIGYAHALTPGLTWEAGATRSIFSGYAFWNYSEAFAGLLGERWNVRLYYASDYFGHHGRQTWYGEFNYAQPLDDHWRLLAHLGAMQSAQSVSNPYSQVLDASIGIAAKFGSASFALKRSAMNHDNYLYTVATPAEQGTWVVSLAYSY
jgi:uncharacterized protein (TIGR02001 family)